MKVFIDAGHNNSGWNTGAVGNGLREQDISFAVAKELSSLLSSKGVETKLSRPTKETNLGTNNTTAINARWQMANAWKANYFISVHCNSVDNANASGTEVLYCKPDSIIYAEKILHTYIKKTRLESRGIKYRNDVAVIRNTLMPAILIELAFISNLNDANFMKNNVAVMAQGIADGLFELCGIKEDEELQEAFKMEKRYKKFEELPEWAKPTIKKLMDKGLLYGDENGDVDLSPDMVRVFIVNDRAGNYN